MKVSFSLIFHPCPASSLFSSPASCPVTQSWGSGPLSYYIVNYWWRMNQTGGRVTAVQQNIHSRTKTTWTKCICTMQSLHFYIQTLMWRNVSKWWWCSSSMEIQMCIKNICRKESITAYIQETSYNNSLQYITVQQYHSFLWWLNHDNNYSQWKKQDKFNDGSGDIDRILSWK